MVLRPTANDGHHVPPARRAPRTHRMRVPATVGRCSPERGGARGLRHHAEARPGRGSERSSFASRSAGAHLTVELKLSEVLGGEERGRRATSRRATALQGA
jgi:hypothetical protein